MCAKGEKDMWEFDYVMKVIPGDFTNCTIKLLILDFYILSPKVLWIMVLFQIIFTEINIKSSLVR